jgi:hypothetical protein
MAKITLFFKSHAIGVHELALESTVVGRDASCDIRIDSSAIAGRHAVIEQKAGKFSIRPLAPGNRVAVNNEAITLHPLSHGDIIRIGKHSMGFAEDAITLDFTQHKAAAEADNGYLDEEFEDDDRFSELVNTINTLPNGCIQILSGEHLGKVIPLQRSLLRLGITGNECAVIAHRSDGYYLSHLEGTTPPLVNGESIGEHSVLLGEGSIIRIGQIEMRFHQEMPKAAVI